jgi:hypothetical protein
LDLIRTAYRPLLANLATKDDLRDGLRLLEERMTTKFESELRKQRRWFFAAQVALFGALAAAIKLL